MADKRIALLKRANKFFRQGKAEEAVKEYKKILEINPEDLEVRRIIGDLERRQGNIKEAIEQFEWIANYYLKQGYFAKAIAMYKRILRIDPNYESALFKLAELYTKQGLVMEAKQIYLDFAEEAKKQNNQKKALDMYKKILEFDRSNIKMRLLLADNYLKEGLENDAIHEYITAADTILNNKKDYRRAEELLLTTLEKIKDMRIIEKLLQLYIKVEDDDKAINLLTKHEQEVFKSVELMKILGGLYVKKNMFVAAESIFSKLLEIDPEIDQGVIEGIMKVGEFYLQRKKYDKIYQLFLPLIDKNIQNKKFEEAESLLRFIITSNNSYLPALTKLAELFRLSGNTNNLIVTYKSLIPLYEEKGMKKELKGILEELIQLLDMPSSYEERLIILVEEEKNKEVILIEEKARECISKRQYADGKRYLLKAIDLNTELIQRFEEEFGFLYNLGNQSNDKEKTWKRKAGQVEWRQQVWQTLSSRNKFELKNIDEEYTDITPDEDEIANIIDDQEDKTAEQKGKELEQAIMALFRDFFNECKETCDILPVKERRQKGGLQFGYDLEFIICELKGSRKLKLLIECKNYTDKIKLEDIAGKLDAVKADSYFSDVDHWILISPRSNATNELNRILKLWEKVGEYPFNVHLWTPETQVDNFFAVNPGIYDKFFEPPKGKVHPKDWDEKQKRENIEFWKRQLEPPLRLPKGWMDYLRNPLKLRLHGDSSELENLYQNHVALKCKDESGTELAQTLEEKVLEWLEQSVSTNPSIILLGEFGDGKTVFTYLLARKLTEKFLESPSTGWIPIRFSLKDFGLETVKNSRDFVRRRLEEFGADIDGWNTLKLKKYRILAILDGFDEISKKLDHKTVFKNINELIECYKNEFFDVKLLITSRKHFFENQQDKDRLLQRIGNPQLLHLSPIDRKTTEDHLNKYAREIDSEEKFKKLRNYHDPIGLASKPLYLEMVKASLKELPEKNLNELILYETYTKKSLERKDELLEDEKLETPPTEVINNMMEILEEIAVRLHQSNEEYVYLSEFKGPLEIRKRLWAMTVYDETTSEDETARIAVRSLLRRIKPNEESESKKWPVDFCHRSMREYFVAHGVCKMLRNNLKEARQFLKNHSLNHEIVFFASELMKKDDFEYEENLLNLIRTTKNLNNMEKLNIGYLGCNAVNLLYRYKGSLLGKDWSNLILDGANLSEADLSGKDFSNSSLQYANLDNVNFRNAIFSNCNLTGVRLEETSEIESIGVSPGRNVYVSYSDGFIREWVYERVRTPYSKILYKDKKLRNIKLTALPGNDMTILAGQYLAFYDNVNNELERKSIFDIKSEVKLIKATLDALLLLELKDNQNILHLVNLKEQEIIKSIGIPLSIHFDHLDDRAFIIYDEKTGIQLIDISSKKRENLPIQLQKGEYITCLNTHRCRHLPGQYRLGVGQKNGAIQIWDINLDEWEASLLFKEKFHEKTIKDIAFIDEERVIFGGFDKKLSLISINQKGELKCDPLELKIAMQCQGMQINGVVREEERSLLEKLIAKSSS